jgi:DNA-binding Lrp family transcriptional regulator
MSNAILTAIRQHTQLKGSLKLTAQEIVHRASSAGFVRVSYGYLASKTGLTIQTMIAHVKRLEALGILRKQKVWISARRCAVNLYTLLIRPLHRCSTQKNSEKFPEAEREEEKCGSLREKIATLKTGLRFYESPTSIGYQSSLEEITRLEALQRSP